MDNKFKSCVLTTGTVNNNKPVTSTCECEVYVPYNPKGIVSPMMPFGNCVNCGLPREEGNREK